jgi:hypothetical protein
MTLRSVAICSICSSISLSSSSYAAPRLSSQATIWQVWLAHKQPGKGQQEVLSCLRGFEFWALSGAELSPQHNPIRFDANCFHLVVLQLVRQYP